MRVCVYICIYMLPLPVGWELEWGICQLQHTLKCNSSSSELSTPVADTAYVIIYMLEIPSLMALGFLVIQLTLSQLGFDLSLKPLMVLATLKSCDTMKQSVCGWLYIYSESCSTEKFLFIYWFTCKCDVCYIGRTSQCLEIRINQHIPSNIWIYTCDYTMIPSSCNSTSAIGCHLLANQTCTCVYSPTMFTILETSTNGLQISILETLFIKNSKPELCIQKQTYTPLLFNNLLGPSEENIINRTNSAGLQ